MNDFKKKYFLGSNSSSGFYSAFSECYSAKEGWMAYIIKGGPGTGKSSFMKHFAAEAAKKGYDPELCLCSSDPASLDGVIISCLKTVVIDGTAPHIVEPQFPGVCEQILNFGEFWDTSKFEGKAEKVIAATEHNRALHKVASRYMQAVGQLMSDNYKTALACTDKKKAAAFSEKLCRRYIPAKGGTGREWVRFLQGITPSGIVAYTNTVNELAGTVIPVMDEFGSASNIIMSKIREHSISAGYEIITLKNPILPDLLTDHIIIPELSLAFVTENKYLRFNSKERRIHARRFVSSKQIHSSRKRIYFNRKTVHLLLISAAEALKEAKAVHDRIEKFYIDAMDFEALTRFADDFSKKVLG